MFCTSVRSQIDKMKARTITSQDYQYDLIDSSSIDSENKILNTRSGFQIKLSQIVNQSLSSRALYLEKIYFDEQNPKTIYKLASSGLHSRFALLWYLQQQDNNKRSSPQKIFQ